jgi:hypothetical protein
MKTFKLRWILPCLIGWLAAGSASAAEVLYAGTGFMSGQQSFTDTFQVSGPGTLIVSLTNVAWPEQLASLDMVVGTTSGLLGPEMGAGTQTFDIKSAGMVYADWFGTAQGPLDTGVYSMNIQFMPAGATVPLPYSIALLASGLLLLLWQRRRSASADSAAVAT